MHPTQARGHSQHPIWPQPLGSAEAAVLVQPGLGQQSYSQQPDRAGHTASARDIRTAGVRGVSATGLKDKRPGSPSGHVFVYKAQRSGGCFDRQHAAHSCCLGVHTCAHVQSHKKCHSPSLLFKQPPRLNPRGTADTLMPCNSNTGCSIMLVQRAPMLCSAQRAHRGAKCVPGRLHLPPATTTCHATQHKTRGGAHAPPQPVQPPPTHCISPYKECGLCVCAGGTCH